ncbi:uncharacterized protein LAESUDRAFT_724704 [Laetiporus sulphureus 93-53]|uniref:histidine kinase n=1 Tax=Laetiporus sulphureus 93-53 TaxID=1314785 RepID=A0A165ET88_9APHY|nr:uncharacterized protein LAESUDRAFT_724704 [Laetiporus sulphureus 93-53]KZT07710.1 hypothetical protein LAESUDRAFT_724704 [Laetiporus sulphureus 93-53]
MLPSQRPLPAPTPTPAALSLDDLSRSLNLPHNTAAYTLPTIPRLALQAKTTHRPIRRPSTASSAEERPSLLPSSPSPAVSFSSTCAPCGVHDAAYAPDSDADTRSSMPPLMPSVDGPEDASISEMNRRAHAAVEGLRAEASRLANAVDVLPSPFDPTPVNDSDEPQLQLQLPPASEKPATANAADEATCDWAAFVHAYALGRWDPLRTPHPPRSQLQAPSHPGARDLGAMVPTKEQTQAERDREMFESPCEMHPPETLHDREDSGSTVGAPEPAVPLVDGIIGAGEVGLLSLSPMSEQHPVQPHTTAIDASPASTTASSSTSAVKTASVHKRPGVPLSLGAFPHRLRSAFPAVPPTPSHAPHPSTSSTSAKSHARHTSSSSSSVSSNHQIPTTEATTTAAAIRWAGARVSVAPLALPSPEHELTDPMRGVTAVIPGSHPPDAFGGYFGNAWTATNGRVGWEGEPVFSPGTGRKTRLSSFWQGTQDVEEGDRVEDEDGRGEESDGEKEQAGVSERRKESGNGHVKEGSKEKESMKFPLHPPPATAPVTYTIEESDGDYFGAMDGMFGQSYAHFATTSERPSKAVSLETVVKHERAESDGDAKTKPLSLTSFQAPLADHDSQTSKRTSVSASPETTSTSHSHTPSITTIQPLPTHANTTSIISPPGRFDAQTVPALPRRICLTRQTSAPLPLLSSASLPAAGLDVANGSGGIAVIAAGAGRTGRAAKEEQMFSELGYLAPPNPQDELERRRALYRFNIWGTGRDVNFDRIAHLVKLVFSTKVVTISLVDGTEEFFKSESGFGTQNMPRTSSFDAHAILQRDDEPMVVHDAQEDWRFARNPLVIGTPRIRFYAGCPLRTQDGYNIGVLAIIDDVPRREFGPRQRHTLKEFAQIAMRELELWKDKIQLRIRDRIQNSMEQFTRECLDLDKEADGEKGLFMGTSMEQVYERAARLVKRTLDVEGAIVLDVSHVDVLETIGAESAMSITLHNADRQAGSSTSSKSLSREEYARLTEFFARYPDGKVCEGIVPATLRPFLPTRIQYALAVPIFNIDKQPFALLCAYSTGERTTPFLEGHELSYLRAIGVIILSAVLKRRMVLADKAKSLFISNISHELRTPLHGILASAELLSDTPLDHSQTSFLQTVEACGTSLVETVNHVLDFTKLSGNAKAGGVENAIQHSRVDLMQLVEEAIEGGWIGHRARMFTSEIGSVYSPPKQDRPAVLPDPAEQHVETVIDIDFGSTRGWTFMCEKGGIRRVLMNVFGNSLKFTSDGYVHVMLRQLPPTSETPSDKVRLELSVIDTGKGISQHFLKNQLFHPFSQENPLQTGTGLGLAIVNSIVRSRSVDGKVDVWSAEGVGTEIKITFDAEPVEEEQSSSCDEEMVQVYDHMKRPTVSLLGFNDSHRGVQLLRSVVRSYLVSRWGFTLAEEDTVGQIVIVNEDLAPLAAAIDSKQASRPFIILSSLRGDPRLMNMVGEYERIGGFCRIVYKPVGPIRLHAALKMCLHIINIGQGSRTQSTVPTRPESPVVEASPPSEDVVTPEGILPRRCSEDGIATMQCRPALAPRAATIHPLASWSHMTISAPADGNESEPPDSSESVPSTPTPLIAVGSGGTLLRSSVGSLGVRGPLRVLVIEDNSILRNLLIKWLRNKGYDFREAVDGQEGVSIFESDGHFDVVLVDLSMPVLDGVGATMQMRSIETMRKRVESRDDHQKPSRAARILALTGMSSLEDKRRAFEAGVDGYLVKPVAFKTLDTMFHKLGITP